MSRKARVFFLALLLGTVSSAIACGAAQSDSPCPTMPPPLGVYAPVLAGSSAAAQKPVTEDDARRFLAQLDKDLLRLTVAGSRAEWVYETYINDDTEAVTTAAQEALGDFTTHTILDARKFDGIRAQLPAPLARQLALLKVSQDTAWPLDADHRGELAGILSWMPGVFAKGKYCSARFKSKDHCLKIDALEHLRDNGKTYEELLEEWNGWHETGKAMRKKFERYVELQNEGAHDIGFSDAGALWRSRYDMSPEDFEKDIERLWGQVKPLYDDLHCFARARLRKVYGADKVPVHAPIPAHLFGNMWAQSWEDIADLLVPYKGEPTIDATANIVKKKLTPQDMVRLGERFFTSLGFDKLPDTFWERSLFVRPKDRDVVCHASAWDVQFSDDLRIKACIDPKENDLLVIHHELGHDFYYQSYFQLPILFQQGANDGFHEGIGDTIALSVTPDYLKRVGLLDVVPQGDHGRLNQQMKMALQKISFLPFGLLIDKWRWDIFNGKTPKDRYNAAWWALRAKYQGIAPDKPRGEDDFDGGAKYHVPANVPYIRYFLAHIYQFQFHRALCKAAGYSGPIDQCSIYGNKVAGAKLHAMLSMGASQPWQDALAALSGERQADATAILDYFAPLRAWLAEQNKGEQCGW
jgi:peptidyl-dipeptidase A